jgi:hypothetical protein
VKPFNVALSSWTGSWWGLLAVLPAGFLTVAGLVGIVLSVAWPRAPVYINVRWQPDVSQLHRQELERRFQLTVPRNTEGTTWQYELQDSSTANIRLIIQSEYVADTEHLNRIRFRPEFAQDRSRQILMYSLLVGFIAAVLVAARSIRSGRVMPFSLPTRTEVAAHLRSAMDSARATASVERSPPSWQLASGVLLAGVAVIITMSLAGVAVVQGAVALLVVYICGYVAGVLFVRSPDGLAWTIIRTLTGLLLTSIAFLLSLVMSVAWLVGPAAVVACAMWVGRWEAVSWSFRIPRVRLDGLGAALITVILLSPVTITFFHMAPGDFPPVFYNVDTPAVVEKVHALVGAGSFPPESLSNVGARRTYHYGTHAMAALISRISGLRPHHALFLLVMPLLVLGVAAAAVAAARGIAPRVPCSLAVPLLLISTPGLSTSFWATFAPQLWSSVTSGVSLERLVGDFGQWGILSNEAKNIGGDFVLLASIAGIAATRVVGWLTPAFLIGTAIIVKTPAGVALVAGLLLAEAWRTVRDRQLRPSALTLVALAIFAATFAAFFMSSYEDAFRVELFPLYHLRAITAAGNPAWFVADILWLVLPAVLVLGTRRSSPEWQTLFLLMAIAPILVVNVTRLVHVAETGGGAGDDWMQILHLAPFMFHAFVLSIVGSQWNRLGRGRRTVVLVVLLSIVAPVVTAAGRYSYLLVRNPENGHEFVDNRPLAEALSRIPTNRTVIVTNDLRYPAQNFSRDERQMQIPALFGHQAFAVNYAYEVVPSAAERRELQQLLQRTLWTDEIGQAARTHGWTHFVVRKDYVHPAPIPLERVYENDVYAVFRFPSVDAGGT